jgi:endonuclease YncB( thermonuclease family)
MALSTSVDRVLGSAEKSSRRHNPRARSCVLPAAAVPIPAGGPVLIVDGDTIKTDGVTIRLLDIEAPRT